MGLRFRKSIKLIPGVKLNLNKNSASITFGGKGFHHTVNSNGKQTTTVGLPGTGLSYTDISTSKQYDDNYNSYSDYNNYNNNTSNPICTGIITFILWIIAGSLVLAAECFICKLFNYIPSDDVYNILTGIAYAIPVIGLLLLWINR